MLDKNNLSTEEKEAIIAKALGASASEQDAFVSKQESKGMIIDIAKDILTKHNFPEGLFTRSVRDEYSFIQLFGSGTSLTFAEYYEKMYPMFYKEWREVFGD